MSMPTAQRDASEKSSSSKTERPSAINGDRALRINEVTYSSSIKNKNIHKEGPDGGEDGPQRKKRCYERLTSQQSDILDSFFSTCAHPNEDQRKQLSEMTGLEEIKVRFWFQNKRMRVKHVSGKEENYRLNVENKMLRDENNMLKQIQRTIFCPSCTGEPRQLQILQETKTLKSQNERMRQELARLNSKLLMSSHASSRAFQFQSSSENVFVLQDDARMLTEIARDAVNELVTLASSNAPMWISVSGGSLETLNKMDHVQAFSGLSSAMGHDMEATRANAMVMLDSKSIVEAVMDAERYKTFFPGIMSGATTTKVYNWPSSGNAGYDGAMVLLKVEAVFPSSLVPAEKYTFLRYCKMLEYGAIAIVDVTVDDSEGSLFKCRKMPSGLLIQPLRTNSCKITIIEHVRVQDTGVHDFFKPCLSGLLFGARRWVMSMARQCARIRDVSKVSSNSMSGSTKGRSVIVQMADTLLTNYVGGIAGIPTEAWSVQCGQGKEEDVIKIMYKRKDDGTNTAIVCASTSFMLTVPMRRAFDLLKNNILRPKWDDLVNGRGGIKEEVRVANGIGSDDSISILHVRVGTVGSKETKMILQNSSYDISGSFLVYSPLEKELTEEMNLNLGSGNQEMGNTSLFPTGFFLVPIPDALKHSSNIGEAGGTVMTAGHQTVLKLARGTGLCPRAVSSLIKFMSEHVANVKDTLMNSHPIFYKGTPSTV